MFCATPETHIIKWLLDADSLERGCFRTPAAAQRIERVFLFRCQLRRTKRKPECIDWFAINVIRCLEYRHLLLVAARGRREAHYQRDITSSADILGNHIGCT